MKDIFSWDYLYDNNELTQLGSFECELAIGYGLNGQESLFEYPSRYSVVVYVILTRIIFFVSAKKFQLSLHPSLKRLDFHTST